MVRNGSYLLNFQTRGGSLPLKGLLAKVSPKDEKHLQFSETGKFTSFQEGGDVTKNNSSPG